MYPWSRPYVPHAARPLQAHPLSACLPGCLPYLGLPCLASRTYTSADTSRSGGVAVDVAARIDTLLVVYCFAIAALRRIPSRGAAATCTCAATSRARTYCRRAHVYVCIYIYIRVCIRVYTCNRVPKSGQERRSAEFSIEM